MHPAVVEAAWRVDRARSAWRELRDSEPARASELRDLAEAMSQAAHWAEVMALTAATGSRVQEWDVAVVRHAAQNLAYQIERHEGALSASSRFSAACVRLSRYLEAVAWVAPAKIAARG
jgi:hypothetical protein